MSQTSSIEFLTYEQDPIDVKKYTLSNGLQLLLSVNNEAPRIFTNIAVRAGSKHDPADTTGLAHYLEHMMFKGTAKIGALKWHKEKQLLDQIADLYEKYRQETDPTQRKDIYRQIDQISNQAALLVAANEYDKLCQLIGADKTNAYTWFEQTVYVNDIPANELERWMELEVERFKMVTLRLFHTELETVYEEFNINQDRDFRKVSQVMNEALYPSHPYGTQTTIGKGEHLKNPSHYRINDFFNTYYRPNNMAIVLAGDFDPEEVVRLAEKYFGQWEAKPIPPFEYEPQEPISEPVRKDVLGQKAAYLQLAWRFGGASSDDVAMMVLIKGILFNQRAGLMDLNLLKKQELQEAYAYYHPNEDYSSLVLNGKPREGQTLEAVEGLLMQQIEELKAGRFDDWLLEAVIKDYRLSEMRSFEKNEHRVSAMTNSFILGMDWGAMNAIYAQMEAISKEDLVAFAQANLANNFVAIYKQTGEDPNVIKVEKPEITPIEVNREEHSSFFKTFSEREERRMEPIFVDYNKEIVEQELVSGIKLEYVENQLNPTFSLRYIVDMGKNSEPLLPVAMNYLLYLGTDKYSSEELQMEFFRLGLSFDVYAGNKKTYVRLDGLEESMEEGVRLLEHILSRVQPNEAALEFLIADILTKRQDETKNKDSILRNALKNYAYYGELSPYTDLISEDRLRSITPNELVAQIHQLLGYDHHIYFYGQRKPDEVVEVLDQHHVISLPLKPVIPPRVYPEVLTEKNSVKFVHFPMVQTEILLMSRGTDHFSLEEFLMAELYNEYFGVGMSSIVFQEIRESKGFAYSTYAYYRAPDELDEGHYLQAFVGTQPDKMKDALHALLAIIEDMPILPKRIQSAAEAVVKRLETTRVKRSRYYWNRVRNRKLQIDRDIRKDVYDFMKQVRPDDLIKFHQEMVKNRQFTILVLGDKNLVDMEYLQSLGELEELSAKQLFGY